MLNSDFEDLKAATRASECRLTPIRKNTAVAAVEAVRALQKIAGMPVGNNPLAEAQRMREIAAAAVGELDGRG